MPHEAWEQPEGTLRKTALNTRLKTRSFIISEMFSGSGVSLKVFLDNECDIRRIPGVKGRFLFWAIRKRSPIYLQA
jgi:hypothetical protein